MEIKNEAPFSRFSPSMRRTNFWFLATRNAERRIVAGKQGPAGKTKNGDGVMRVPRGSPSFFVFGSSIFIVADFCGRRKPFADKGYGSLPKLF